LVLFLFAGHTPAAAQGKKAFCVDYADEAVSLHRKNLELGCGFTDLRWHEWWDGHYGWCKDWVSQDKVEDEQDLRRIRIRKCSADQGYGRDRYEGRRSERRNYER